MYLTILCSHRRGTRFYVPRLSFYPGMSLAVRLYDTKTVCGNSFIFLWDTHVKEPFRICFSVAQVLVAGSISGRREVIVLVMQDTQVSTSYVHLYCSDVETS